MSRDEIFEGVQDIFRDIFDEDGTVMGVIYMTKVLGFTWIYE